MRINNKYYNVDWNKLKKVAGIMDHKSQLKKGKNFWKKIFKQYVGQIRNKNDVDYKKNRYLID